MMRFGVRFWPPNIPLTPEVHWLLLRAFGPCASCAFPTSEDYGRIAEAFGLTQRILSRCARNVLGQELTGVEQVFAKHERRLAANRSLLDAHLGLVESAARSLGRPYALLGDAALAYSTVNTLQRKRIQTVDILVCQPDAHAFFSALNRAEERFAIRRIDRSCTELRADGERGIVRIHTELPHVRMIPGGQAVTMQQLLDSARSSSVRGLSELCHLPDAALLLAHTMARGIAQYGFLPREYPPLSTLADVIDLEIFDNPTRATQALWWVQPDVTYHEVTALREIAKLLQAGEVERAWAEDNRNGRLLRHLVLGPIDDGYAAGLLAYEAMYRVLLLKKNGSYTADLACTLRELNHWLCSVATASLRELPTRQRSPKPAAIAAGLAHMVPHAAAMGSRQFFAFAQLALGTRRL